MSLPLVYHPDYVTPLPPEHRFPMPKFGRIYETLLCDGIAGLDQFHIPEVADYDQLSQVHTQDFISDYLAGTLDAKAMRRIGFPWSKALVQRTCTAIGGTILTAQLALQHGIACNTAGGTHHAFADYGSGYCIFNDLAIAARTMQAQFEHIDRVLIIDLDVHQGDGTAAIFQDDPTIFTFSIHCQKNFPLRKQKSDLDIGLPEGADDTLYRQTLAQHVPALLDKMQPDLVIYDAGVDPHVDDQLGKLALSDSGIYQRDYFVLENCVRQRTPVACVVGGGYSKNIDALAKRHSLLFRAASKIYNFCLDNCSDFLGNLDTDMGEHG